MARPWKIPGKKRFYGKGKGAGRRFSPPPDKDAVALAFIEQALKDGKRVTSAGMSQDEVRAKFGNSHPDSLLTALRDVPPLHDDDHMDPVEELPAGKVRR